MMSIANSRDQAIDRARGTIGRPATSTRSLLQVRIQVPWRWISGPNSGNEVFPRGVRAFANGDFNPARGSANLLGTTYHGILELLGFRSFMMSRGAHRVGR